jgi:hypothetical protein
MTLFRIFRPTAEATLNLFRIFRLKAEATVNLCSALPPQGGSHS